MNVHREELVDSILQQLKLMPASSPQSGDRLWVQFVRKHPQEADRVSQVLARLFHNILAYYLELSPIQLSDREEIFARFWHNAAILLIDRQGNLQQDLQSLQQVGLEAIRDALQAEIAPILPVIPSLPLFYASEKYIFCNGGRSHPVMVMADDIESFPVKPQALKRARWQYQPLPENEPDLHPESFCKGEKSLAGGTLIAARVRGKKHKHDGTNCDDWFEFSSCGDWNIIAVADGAGSKKFSRVGARVACKGAVRHLEEALKGHNLKKRQNWSVESFKRDEETGAFAEEDLECLQNALHEAIAVAYDAIDRAVKERVEYVKYYKILQHRDIEMDDLATTLLLAIHRRVQYKNTIYSLVLTCQVGDGLTVALDGNNKLHLLGIPDRGEFSGQTEFLTSPGKIERDCLMRKTFPFFSPLNALMVMTDGVADDYFPADPEMLRLYGDLVLNRVIDLPHINTGEMVAALSDTKLGDLRTLEDRKVTFQKEVDRLVHPEEYPKKVCLSYSDRYAESLGCSMSDLLQNPALLAATYWQDERMRSPEENLRLWLDSYQVKGSFDDRTLVVLNPSRQSKE